MKVILLIPSLRGHGAERVVSELSLNFPSEVERVIVLFEQQIAYPYKGKLISLNCPASKNFFIKILHFLKRFFQFKKILKKESPDWTISFLETANLINVLSTKRAIISTRTLLSDVCKGFYGKIYGVLVKVLYNKAARIIVVSETVKDDLIKNFWVKKEKIEVIYNPIDVKKIQKLAQEEVQHPWFKEKTPIVISSGRLVKAKGQWHLIRAFLEVRKQIPCRLVILGEGELRKYLEKLARELNLESDVLFLGWQKNPFKFLAKSDIFVLTSLREGFPNALVEAMTCGLPVISSDCRSGPREILAPNTNPNYQTKDVEYSDYGILTPICDGRFYQADHLPAREEMILANIIIEILKDKDLKSKYEKVSLERVNTFNVEKIINHWLMILKRQF